MKIQIENYFGNDILTLRYHQLNVEISKSRMIAVGTLASTCGYDVADIDTDEDGQDYIRVQEVNVDNTEKEGRKDLLELIHKLNTHFL
jgi:hypothetical protein